MKKSSSCLKKPQKKVLDSSSDADSSLEVEEIEDLPSKVHAHALSPGLKVSFASTLENVLNDTVIHKEPLHTDRAVHAIFTQQCGDSPKVDNRPTEKTSRWVDRTAKKKYKSSNNPHRLMRATQKEKYIWYATFDEEMQAAKFLELLNSCSDLSHPIDIKGVQVEGHEIFFTQNGSHGCRPTIKVNQFGTVFMRAYLIKKQQFNYIVLRKNRVMHESLILNIEKLQTARSSQSVILNEISSCGTIVRLGDYEKIPMYTVALPPLSCEKSGPIESAYLKRMLFGLLEAFPAYSQDFFLFYLYSKKGIQEHYTIKQLAQISLAEAERPVTPGIVKRFSNGIIEECEGNKENDSCNRVSHIHGECPKNSIISQRISVLDRVSILSSKNREPLLEIKPEERTSKESTAKSTESSKVGALIGNGNFASGMKNCSSLFSSEERSESLNDEDYEYTQLNTSTLKELSDLHKESQFDSHPSEFMPELHDNQMSSMAAADLFCSENINEIFSHSQF